MKTIETTNILAQYAALLTHYKALRRMRMLKSLTIWRNTLNYWCLARRMDIGFRIRLSALALSENGDAKY